MKKNLFAVLAVLLLASPVFAGECFVVNPVLDGNDVLLPDIYVATAEGADPPYATNNLNGWLVRKDPDGTGKDVNWQSADRLEMTKLVRESGNCWRARGMRGVRFGVARLRPDGTPDWAEIERFWVLPGFLGANDFVTNTDGGVALVVK